MSNPNPATTEKSNEEEPLDLNNPPFPLTAIDRKVLATKDEDFHRYTWQDLQDIIARNSLEDLKRLPSDLHRYLRWSYKTKAAHGSITNFVISDRLFWKPKHAVTPEAPITAHSFTHHSTTPFQDPRDYAVLLNDWPYGFMPGIKHLLVWSRTPIAVDADKGDVTPESRRLIEQFVNGMFVMGLAEWEDFGDVDRGSHSVSDARGKVQWFKNWVSLQSVRGVDHIHVLVRDVPDQLIEKWVERRDL